MLGFVIAELEARKGTWPSISRAMDPRNWESYYSWMTKVAQGQIPDPGVRRIEELAAYLREHKQAA